MQALIVINGWLGVGIGRYGRPRRKQDGAVRWHNTTPATLRRIQRLLDMYQCEARFGAYGYRYFDLD